MNRDLNQAAIEYANNPRNVTKSLELAFIAGAEFDGEYEETVGSFYQVCPLCKGVGKVWDYFLQQVYPFPESIKVDNVGVCDCPVCNGKRVIKNK